MTKRHKLFRLKATAVYPPQFWGGRQGQFLLEALRENLVPASPSSWLLQGCGCITPSLPPSLRRLLPSVSESLFFSL